MRCTCGKMARVRYRGTERYLCSNCLDKEGQKVVDKFTKETDAMVRSCIRTCSKPELMPFPKPEPELLVRMYEAWKHWHYSIDPMCYRWPPKVQDDYTFQKTNLALTGFVRKRSMWQNIRRPDGVLELRSSTGFTLERQMRNAEEMATNSLLPNIDDEPQDDDSWIQEAFERFDRPEFNEAGHHPREERARNGKAGHFWNYTHYHFVRQPETKRYREFVKGCKQEGKIHATKCSLQNRERGYINGPGDLPDELSWPVSCVISFYAIPNIENPVVISDKDDDGFMVYEEYTDEELAKCFKIINQKYNLTLPTTAKTVKKMRDNPLHPPWFPPRIHQLYAGTPIGNLLEAAPKPGRAALNSLFNSFMMWFFEYYVCPRDEPTREFMIKSFMEGPRKAGVIFPKKDLAEKQFDLLVKYGVIKSLERSTNPDHELYFATRKRTETTALYEGTREYYISLNS